MCDWERWIQLMSFKIVTVLSRGSAAVVLSVVSLWLSAVCVTYGVWLWRSGRNHGFLFRTLQSSLRCCWTPNISYICVIFTTKSQCWNSCDHEIVLVHNNQMSSWVCLEQPEESVPVFVMNSPGAELNCHGVTLTWCRVCQYDYGNSHPTVSPFRATPKLTSSTSSPGSLADNSKGDESSYCNAA